MGLFGVNLGKVLDQVDLQTVGAAIVFTEFNNPCADKGVCNALRTKLLSGKSFSKNELKILAVFLRFMAKQNGNGVEISDDSGLLGLADKLENM